MMKRLATLLIGLSLSLNASATNYYLSNAGDDNATGTSASTAWATITKLNTVTYFPNDTVFLRSGDVFQGSINVDESGDPTGRIVFMPYGSGPAPVISGSIPVTNWTVSGNHYEASITQTVRNLVVNGKMEEIARYPNNHQYLWLDSAKTNYLLDAAMPSLDPNLFISSKICVHSDECCWEKTGISRLTLDSIHFNAPLQLEARNGFAYFLFDNVNHIDTVGEWSYSTSTRKLHYFPAVGVDPNTIDCQASIYAYGIQLGVDVCYVTIEGIDFERQGIVGVNIPDNGSFFTHIRNCHFRQQGQFGIQDKGSFSIVSNNQFSDIAGIGVYLLQTAGNTEIDHNTFRNIGSSRHGGVGQQINLSAICLSSVDSCHVHHNDIDSTGYCGIAADGYEHVIERNVVRNAMRLNNDGAAIKCGGLFSYNNVFRNNFVRGSNGNTEGTNGSSFSTPGLYFGQNVNNCVMQENTIWEHTNRGIYQGPASFDNEIRGNVVYGAGPGIDLDGSNPLVNPISGIEVKRNTFFALQPGELIIREIDHSGVFQTGNIDSNYSFQPYSSSIFAYRFDGQNASSMNFSDWQTTGNDLHSKATFVNWTLPQNDSQLFQNMTDSPMQISLQGMYFLDLDSNLLCGTITLAPFTARVLINTGQPCTIDVANEIEPAHLQTFPNPATDYLFVNVDGKLVGKAYRVINLQGQMLLSGKIEKRLTELSLTTFPRGMYLLEVGDLGEYTARFVVQ